MRRVLVGGAAGRMGREVLRVLDGHAELEIGAAIEHASHPALGSEVRPGIRLDHELGPAVARCDVAIDFTIPAATLQLIDAAFAADLPLVIGTTGFDEAGFERLERASKRLAIVRAANFSLGVNVLLELVASAAKRLPDYDLEILELHHSRKVDAPSGTALRLGEAAAGARGEELGDVATYHREGHTGPREPGTIGLQTLRAGDSVGEHTVYLAGPGERLELSHRALSRENFAAGAARAALWVQGRPPGLYAMQDVLESSGQGRS